MIPDGPAADRPAAPMAAPAHVAWPWLNMTAPAVPCGRGRRRGWATLAGMDITLTDAAARRVRKYLEEQPDRLGLRFGVRRTGCSGWGYAIDLADASREGDTVIEDQGIRIYVDADSLPLVSGTRIDFIEQDLGSQFVFHNPNAAAACGCGESFTADPEAA